MKLMSAVNGFLESFYASLTPPVGPDGHVTAQSFYESVLLRAVRSTEFRERLVREPHAVLAEVGIVLLDGVTVNVVENTSDTVHIVIPPYIGG